MYWICQLSNLALLAPIVAAFQYKLYMVCITIALCALASVFYHLDETNEKLFLFDLFGIICMVSLCSYMFIYARKSFTYVNLMTIMYMGVGLYFFLIAPDPTLGFSTREEHMLYHYYHSTWHVFVGYSIFGVLYSFLNSSEDYSLLSNSVIAYERNMREFLASIL